MCIFCFIKFYWVFQYINYLILKIYSFHNLVKFQSLVPPRKRKYILFMSVGASPFFYLVILVIIIFPLKYFSFKISPVSAPRGQQGGILIYACAYAGKGKLVRKKNLGSGGQYSHLFEFTRGNQRQSMSQCKKKKFILNNFFFNYTKATYSRELGYLV